MLQPRQNNLLARLLNLPRQENLVQDRIHLVEVEDQVQLAHVAEEGVEHLDEEVDGLEVGQLVVIRVDARAEKEPRIPPVHELVVAELDEVGLVLLVARGDEAVDLLFGGRAGVSWGLCLVGVRMVGERKRKEQTYLALELDLFVVAVGDVPLGQAGFAPAIAVSEVRNWIDG